MSETKIAREVAEQDIIKWLDHKRVKASKREGQYKEAIDSLIEAISDGNLVLNEDFTFTQKLSFPLMNDKGSAEVNELTFKPRLTVEETQIRLQSVKPGDGDGRIKAFVCALTGKNSGIIGKLDTEDYGTCQNIAVFFIPS